jgi:hypothetical protein
MQTPLPKKRARSKSVEFLSPSFCASDSHGAEERDPKRSHQDYFRNSMATNKRKEGLTKRLEDMTSELGTRDAHFLQRLGQLRVMLKQSKQFYFRIAEVLSLTNKFFVDICKMAGRRLDTSGCLQ